MKNKKVSVIMSTYNESAKDINRAVSSIINQTYKNLEFIIICDNPENYELINLLKKFGKNYSIIKIIINENNLGLATSLNVALHNATGDYIARMDADDESFLERIEKQLFYLEKNHLDLIGCYVECVNETGDTIYYLNNMPKESDEIDKKILHNNPLAHPTWLGKNKVFIDNNGYRNVPYAEDYDFLLRAYTKGYKLGNIDQVLFRYTMRPTSISNSNGLKQYLVSRELVKHFHKKDLATMDLSELALQFNQLNERDQKKYAQASRCFIQALELLHKKKISCIFKGVQACFTSRYYFKKIISYIKAFL